MNKQEARTFGEWLALRRIGQGLSGKALGRLAGIDDSTINRIERGSIVNANAETLLRIGRALGIEDGDLLRRAGVQIADQPLPELPAYLRVKYRHLPLPARAELTAYLARLSERYGLDPNGPGPGEDEDNGGNDRTEQAA